MVWAIAMALVTATGEGAAHLLYSLACLAVGALIGWMWGRSHTD